MKPKVSVQILNYNGKKFLEGCIDSTLKQDYPNFEIVLIDNASIDGSVEFVKERYKREIKKNKIKIIELNRNYGFAGAYNYSYRKTDADYVLLLNNDTLLPDKKMISLMVKRAESDPKTACVSAGIYPFNTDLRKAKEQSPGTLSLILTNTLTPLKGNRLFYSSGCCCLIKKKLIDIPFDSDYFAYSEDVYLGWKVNLLGYKNVLEPKAKLLHYGFGSSGAGSPFVRYYGERNRILNCLIFYETTTLIKILPLLFIYFIVSGLFFMQRPKVFAAYLKAYLWILFHPFKILAKRRKIQRLRKVSDSRVLELLSYKIFFTEPKLTSFYDTLKKRRWLLEVITKISYLLDKLSFLYCNFIGLELLKENTS